MILVTSAVVLLLVVLAVRYLRARDPKHSTKTWTFVLISGLLLVATFAMLLSVPNNDVEWFDVPNHDSINMFSFNENIPTNISTQIQHHQQSDDTFIHSNEDIPTNTSTQIQQHQRYEQSDNIFIHFIQTRFMQGQPNLTQLGKARLDLFETFCLPTITNQTSLDYYWYILTDPNLSKELMVPLKKLLEPYQDRVFLLQENRVLTPNQLQFKDWKLASGDAEVLRRAVEEIKTKILIRTRLDADDGLNIDFVKRIRSLAYDWYRSRNGKKQRKGWTLLCARRIMNWYFGDLNGSAVNASVIKHDPTLRHGVLEDDRASPRRTCVTPGLTFITPPNVTITTPLAHHRIMQSVKPCSKKGHNSGCRMLFSPDNWHQAIRSRSPTSNGMAGVGIGKQLHARTLWKTVERDFRVQQDQVALIHEKMRQNLVRVAHENLTRKCQKGFSCKRQARDKLKEIIQSNIGDKLDVAL